MCQSKQIEFNIILIIQHCVRQKRFENLERRLVKKMKN